MMLVTFAFNLALILSLESFCVYFLVISIWNFLVSFMKSVLFVWGMIERRLVYPLTAILRAKFGTSWSPQNSS
jgi:hypothetical protein